MLVLWMGIQVTVMFFQDKFGPRFFVPKQFLPVKYDYRRPIPSFIVGRGITSHDDEAEQLISRGKGSPSLRKQSEGWCSNRFAFLASLTFKSRNRIDCIFFINPYTFYVPIADVVECDLETGVGSLECSICCAEVMKNLIITEGKISENQCCKNIYHFFFPLILKVETTHQNYMITPCHHVYHPECLTRCKCTWWFY